MGARLLLIVGLIEIMRNLFITSRKKIVRNLNLLVIDLDEVKYVMIQELKKKVKLFCLNVSWK